VGKSFTFRRRLSVRLCMINHSKNIVQQYDLLIIIAYFVRGQFHDHGLVETSNAHKDMHNGQACERNSCQPHVWLTSHTLGATL